MCASFSPEDVEFVEVFRRVRMYALSSGPYVRTFIQRKSTMQAHFRHWVPDVFGREGQSGRHFFTIRGKYAVTCLFEVNIRYDFRHTEALLRALPRSSS